MVQTPFLLVERALVRGCEDPPAAFVVEEALRGLFSSVHLKFQFNYLTVALEI